MNGIKLPDPMNPGYQPYIDIEPRKIPSTNRSRQANLEDLRNDSPRNTPNYYVSEDSVSALRLNNHVLQTHTLGRNVYRSRDVTRVNTMQNRPNVNNSNLTRATDSVYKGDSEGRSVNYESLYTDLNSTILSKYTDGISSVDSFEYKYYRSNDPDEFTEANYNGKKSGQSKIQTSSHANKLTHEKHSTNSKESINHNNKFRTQIVKSTSEKPISQVDIISPPAPNDNSQFYQLTRDELCKGLGSIGLALSKVFSLTGKSVLYLCSSITDNTEGLFETKKNTTDKSTDLHTGGDTSHPTCNCSINSNKDYRTIPDLHINYETPYQLKGGRHKYTNGKHKDVFYDKKPEPSAKSMDNPSYLNDIHLLEMGREHFATNKQETHYRNMNYNKPSDYDRKYVNHAGYHNKVSSHYDDFKIEYDEDLDYTNGNCIPKNGYEHNYPHEIQMNKNLYRDRELRRGDRMVERAVNNRFVNGYSVDEPLNMPKCNAKIPEPAIGLSNLSNNDIRTIQSNNGVQKPIINTSNRRPIEFNNDNLNSHGCDNLKTVGLAERTRKNTLDVTIFGKPCVSAYGSNTNESENKHSEKPKFGPSDGERTSSYKSPDETEVKYLRTEIREQMNLKGDLMKDHKDQSTDEIDDNTSRSFFSISNTEDTSQSNYSRTKSVDGISLGDGSSNKSMNKISITVYDSDKSEDSISTGESGSKDENKKKGKKGMFSFGKKSK